MRAPGPFYLVAVVVGLLGALMGRGSPRRLRIAALTFAVVGLYALTIAPITVFYDPRYVLAALPLCSLSLGLGAQLLLDRIRRSRSTRESSPPKDIAAGAQDVQPALSVRSITDSDLSAGRIGS
jgi:hypothetical protein